MVINAGEKDKEGNGNGGEEELQVWIEWAGKTVEKEAFKGQLEGGESTS